MGIMIRCVTSEMDSPASKKARTLIQSTLVVRGSLFKLSTQKSDVDIDGMITLGKFVEVNFFTGN